MKVIALDPGKTTSYAILDSALPTEIEIGELTLVGSGRLVRPCPLHLSEILADADLAIVEEVGARNEQGVSSVFTFGMALGTILGSIGANAKPLVLVSPQQWKKSSRIVAKDKSVAKTLARSFAREIWPQHEKILRLSTKHGMAEAALMARWYFHAGPGRFVDGAEEACEKMPITPQKAEA